RTFNRSSIVKRRSCPITTPANASKATNETAKKRFILDLGNLLNYAGKLRADYRMFDQRARLISSQYREQPGSPRGQPAWGGGSDRGLERKRPRLHRNTGAATGTGCAPVESRPHNR